MSSSDRISGKARVIAALSGLETDRIPVVAPTSVATLESMQKVKAFFPRAHTDARQMAALAAAGHELFDFDTVAPYFSIVLEAAALGCDVEWGEVETMPLVKSNPLERWESWSIPKNFLSRHPIKSLLESISMLKKRYEERVAVVGKVIGPWTLAYHLCGVQNFLTFGYDWRKYNFSWRRQQPSNSA
ncbi:MAG: uroporphyrinogen decarboxylase family protein [Bacillota bacterium]